MSRLPGPACLSATIERIDDLGRVRFARVRIGDAKFAARVPPGFSVPDNEVGLRVRSRACSRLCRQPSGRGGRLMDKTINQKAWFLVLPVFLVVAFSAILPLMTVVNYSMQDTFGNNQFFWNGVGWFKELLDPSTDLGGRFLASLGRNLLFSAIILAIEVPLGIVVALSMPRQGWTVARVPGDHGAAAADPVERGRHHLADFRPARHRPARLCAQQPRHRLQLRLQRVRRLGHRHRDGRLALDQPRGAAVLRRAEVDPRRLLPGGADRRRLALGGVHARSSCRR